MLSKPIQKNEHRLHTLDFLRGVAILSVIAVHTVQGFPTTIPFIDKILLAGRYGVQLFFFISAFTMCHMWVMRRGETHPVRKFYIRRFARIAPLFWLSIPIYLLVNGMGSSFWAPEGLHLHQILLTTFFLHGFWPDSFNSVVSGSWSIGVEVIFYAFFPWIILRLKDKASLYAYAAVALYFSYTIILKPLLLKLLTAYYTTSLPDNIDFFFNFHFLNQAPIFLLGCSFFFAQKTGKDYKKIIITIVGWVLFAFLTRYTLGIRHYFLWVYLKIAGFFFLSLKLGLHLKLFEHLGKNSYAIYLSHFLVLTFIQYLFKTFQWNQIGLLSCGIAFILVTSISYGISMITDIAIESKIHRFVKRINNETAA